MSKDLSIIGTGFVGTHFLNSYSNEFDHIITTSKTSPKPKQSDQHFQFNIETDLPPNDILTTEIIIITLPFSRQLDDPFQYAKSIKKICSLTKNKKVIFTSSTSIYPSTGRHNEDSPLSNTPRAIALHKAEQTILNHSKSAYVLRLGGICGGNRSSQSKRSADIVKNAATPVNLIHINDIILIMRTLCNETHQSKDIINVVCSEHPTRQDYYSHICSELAVKPPQFDNNTAPHKIISNQKLTTKYNIKLEYKTPLAFTFK